MPGCGFLQYTALGWMKLPRVCTLTKGKTLRRPAAMASSFGSKENCIVQQKSVYRNDSSYTNNPYHKQKETFLRIQIFFLFSYSMIYCSKVVFFFKKKNRIVYTTNLQAESELLFRLLLMKMIAHLSFPWRMIQNLSITPLLKSASRSVHGSHKRKIK